jgi:PAS domain S-box-containing protein
MPSAAHLSSDRTSLLQPATSVLDALPDGVTTFDRSGAVTYCNAAAARLCGFAGADAMLSATSEERLAAFEILDGDGRPWSGEDAPWVKALAGQASGEVLVRFLLRANGEERFAKVASSPLRDEGGAVIGCLNRFRDVTEEARARRESDLERTQHRERDEITRLALAAGKLGTWEWDIQAGRVRWSPELERMHGIPEGSFDGTFEAYQSDMHPEDKERVLASVREVLETHRHHHLLYRIVRPDGEVRWLEANGRLQLASDGKPLRLVGVCSDVTDRMKIEETARRLASEQIAREQAEHARARMAEVLEAITDPFSVLDEDLTIRFANSASAASLGMSPAQIIGKKVHELVPEVSRTRFQEALDTALRDRAPAKIVDYYEPFDRWFEANYYPLESGGVASHSRDITALKHNEQIKDRLARLEQLRADISAHLARPAELRELLQSACAAIVDALDVSFARVWTLDAAGTTLELQASAGLYTHVDGPHARVPVGKFKIGRIAEERLAHVTNDVPHDPRVGNPAWAREQGMVAFAGYPLLVEDRLVGVLAMFSKRAMPEETFTSLRLVADVVAQGIERKRAEESLAERARDLARSNRELEQFAYVASHDLQEPLRTVSSFVQLLQRRYQGKLDPKADEFIGFAVEGATRMQRLIEDLLTFSRVGTRAIEPVEFDASEVMAQVARDLGPSMREAGAELTHDPLPKICADRGRFGQLVQNLVSNAIKFRGSEPPRVHVSVEARGDDWVFAVRDNGIGIDPQYFERIFVIFQRLHGRSKYAGTGIGLSICKKIIDLHGGRIWVESEPGAGSTFYFTLPKVPRSRLDQTR